MGQATSAHSDSEEAANVHEDPSYHFQLVGQKYLYQWQTRQMPEDLDVAIEYLRKSLDSMPEDSLHEAGYLGNLGLSLINRHRITSRAVDVEEGILLAEQALDLTAFEDPYKAGLLQNLGIAYRTEYTASHSLQDLEHCVKLFEEAYDHPEVDEIQKQTCLHGIADGRFIKHERTQSMADLEKGFTRC
ncbi:hypothetical protein NW752_010911 [Fusarium irregulare]|uniref:Uncharacterized protein n=1 Tax=Fusarium irregulare TaxID=2494466 RepID=A0A9W8PEC9_9HYPO|nr:hypothetical protein NW766_011863 [Fusarium irregulare]KAJ4006263.1 hypothetical protein NW752_010911 [Fusarium irregulare]